MKKSLLRAAIVHAPRVVAADGAAAKLLEQGIVPEAVIGDFDSLSEHVRKALPPEQCHRIDEQDSTDFEKCLERIDAPLVIAVGFSGGRLDHQLAVLHGMLRFAGRPCLLLGKHDIVFLSPPALKIALPGESRVSLFPMGPVTARSNGLEWPLDGLALAPGVKIGTSNRVIAGKTAQMVEVAPDAPGLMVILPAAQLAAAVNALNAPGAPRWGVR